MRLASNYCGAKARLASNAPFRFYASNTQRMSKGYPAAAKARLASNYCVASLWKHTTRPASKHLGSNALPLSIGEPREVFGANENQFLLPIHAPQPVGCFSETKTR